MCICSTICYTCSIVSIVLAYCIWPSRKCFSGVIYDSLCDIEIIGWALTLNWVTLCVIASSLRAIWCRVKSIHALCIVAYPVIPVTAWEAISKEGPITEITPCIALCTLIACARILPDIINSKSCDWYGKRRTIRFTSIISNPEI